MAVTGLVAPLELETAAQAAFERYGDFGRGYIRHWADVNRAGGERAATEHVAVARFGAGANMAYRRGVFSRVGGFDPALDVGTPTSGGGDLEMFFRVLKAGYPPVYEPEAIARHRHRREAPALRAQITNNGVGLYAFPARCFWHFPEERLPVARHALWWLLYWFVWRIETEAQRLHTRYAGLGCGLSFLFNRVLPLNIPHYTAFVFTGVLAWSWFSSALLAAPGAIIDNRDLVRRPGFSVKEDATRAPRNLITCAINLAAGLEAAERRLDTERPTAAHLWYITGTLRRHIGVLPEQPGAEPWRGAHLRPFLTRRLALPFLRALAEAGAIHSAPPERLERLTIAIERLDRWYGPGAAQRALVGAIQPVGAPRCPASRGWQGPA